MSESYFTTGIEAFEKEPWDYQKFVRYYNAEVAIMNQKSGSMQYRPWGDADALIIQSVYDQDPNTLYVEDFAKMQFQIDQLS